MFCGENCSCGDGCQCKDDNIEKIRTDKIKLKNLNNIIYKGINKKDISNFEVVHFQLYFLCSKCGYTHKFEKDEAPYYSIRFMANYPCLGCGNIGGFDDFMCVISPDEGIPLDMSDALSEDKFIAALNRLMSIQMYDKDSIGSA
jgi:hypothetical protein